MIPAEFTRSPIKQLSVQLANQIAAGEVVERPASIVKELIENSLDAGASSIEIDIVKGGLELIQIRDNGCGIPKQEIPLAVQAHCTSKISNFDDLTAIISMGFRGEALASIVSISQFEIISAVATDDVAWRWCANDSFGSVPSAEDLIPASHPIGTSISVRNIFYNTIARRKFLSSERTEFRHIEDVVKRIALSRFDVEIILKHNQRVVHRLLPANTDDLKIKRIEKLLDKKFIQDALQVSFQASQLTMTGWLSNKNYSRGQTDMQYFYVNGRTVKDKVINHALRQVYQSILPPGRFPAYVLNLQIDPQQVDVNVHPTKHEVRFRQTRLVHDFVNHVIEKSLYKMNVGEDIYSEVADNLNNEISPNYYRNNSSINDVASSYQNTYPKPYSVIDGDKKETNKRNLLGDAIGFCKPAYIVSHCSQGMALVNLLRVEQYQVEQQWLSEFDNKSIDVKPFIFPLNIELDVALSDRVEIHSEVILSLGFDLSLQNKTTAILRSAPNILKNCQHEVLIRQLLTSLKMEKNITAKEVIQLLSRFIELDGNNILLSIEHWNGVLRKIENEFTELCEDAPYKNKFWRILSITELNKFFQSNVSNELQFDK